MPGKYTEREKLQIQAQEAQSRHFRGEHVHTIKTMSNVQEALESEVLNARSTVPEEEIPGSIQIDLNSPPLAVLPDINNESLEERYVVSLIYLFVPLTLMFT